MPGKEIRKFLAPELVFGVGAIHLAGQYAKNFGASKVLVVTDAGIIKAGWVGRVCASLDQYNLDYEIFASVTCNPRENEVMAGAELYRSRNCDTIVAVGGGSAMDCAKGIGVVSSNNRNIMEFEGVDQIKAPMPPMICVPTTAGTSADVSQFVVITSEAEKRKFAIVSKAVVPDVSLVDPQTSATMDERITACTGMDALSHAIEAYVSTGQSPLTDSHALQAIELIMQNLHACIEEPQNLAKREKVMLGSLQAGLAFSNASLGAVHALSHSLGGFLDLPHGECNALLLEHVAAFNYQACPERFMQVAKAMGLDLNVMNKDEIKIAIMDRLRHFREKAGIKASLASRGVKLSDIPILSRQALNDVCIVTNPRVLNQRDIEVIYEEAF